MEWLTGLALLPALFCGLMMGGMALGGMLGWRRSQPTADTNRIEDTHRIEDSKDVVGSPR